MTPRKPLSRAFLRRWSHCETGQTLVEAAFSIAILLLLVVGIMEIMMALYCYNYVADAAREGARYAMVHGSSCATSTCTVAKASDVQTYVQNLGLPIVDTSNLTVTTTWPDTGSICTPSSTPCNNPGNNVKVAVQYRYIPHIPFMSANAWVMSSNSEITIAQ
jgi:Flp pilus assembly protein TadG